MGIRKKTEIKIPKDIKKYFKVCTSCDGSGSYIIQDYWGNQTCNLHTCPTCNGQGFIIDPVFRDQIRKDLGI